MKSKIKKLAKQTGMTQEQIANEIGVHKSTIKRLIGTLSGNTSIFSKIKVANYLDNNKSKYTYEIDEINTKHYSDRSNILLMNLLEGFDKNLSVVEPFVGSGSLLEDLEEFKSTETFDIIPHIEGAIQRDTLMNPPDYKGKYVITNPPYLARNKSESKEVFDKYQVDDLYKAFIKTLILGGVEGGAMIIPLNFLTDEASENIRIEFLSKYRIENLNIFKCQMFDHTKYNTCSFNFVKGKHNGGVDTLIFEDRTEVKHIEIDLEEKYGFRLFGEFYSSIPKRCIEISRYTEYTQKPTNIVIKCIDGTLESSKIKAEVVDIVEIGKSSDRNSAVIVLGSVISKEQEALVVEKFNNFINKNREKYHDLIFTNFRENNRKRIGFDLAYDILSMFVNEVVNNGF